MYTLVCASVLARIYQTFRWIRFNKINSDFLFIHTENRSLKYINTCAFFNIFSVASPKLCSNLSDDICLKV